MSQRKARVAAMQLIFAAISLDEGAAAQVTRFRKMAVNKNDIERSALTRDIVRCYDAEKKTIEAHIADVCSYRPEELTLLERALLATAVAEMLAHRHTAAVVIINEAVDIAKAFGGDKGYALINGVLNTLSRKLR